MLSKDVVGCAFTDDETGNAMKEIDKKYKYILDPHGAIGYLGLKEYFKNHGSNVTGIFLESAHPGKFGEVVEKKLGYGIELPSKLKAFLGQQKQSEMMSNGFGDFKKYLLSQ